MVRLRAIVLAAAVAVLAAGCGRAGHGEALDRIGALVEDDAAAAASALDSLDRGVMDEAQGNYYDFLKLKSDDKRYERHKSDSTIVRLLEYYRGTEMEAEVTYYAGRVYSDLGDYPTALRYFQDANEMIKGDKRKLALRSHVMSQTGRLLNDMRLYREAIPYLEETIALDSALNCAKDLPLDNQLLGAVYMHLKEYEQAERYFRKALSQATNGNDSTIIGAYIANMEYERGDTASALRAARGLSERCMDHDRNYILAIASRIYHRAGIQDTAVMYATQLIERNEPANKINGYHILLKPDLRKMIAADSLDSYLRNYTRLLEKRSDKNMADQVIYQQSRYNYMLHARETERIAAEKQTLQRWLFVAGIVVLVIVVIAVYYKYRAVIRKAQLATAQNLLLTLDREHKETLTELSHIKDGVSMKDMLKKLSEQMHSRALKEMSRIAESEAYSKIMSALREDKIIQLNDSVWGELDECVRREGRSFDEIISGPIRISLTDMEYAVLLLTKAGFSSADASKILGRAKNSLSHQRNQLRKKVFFDQIDKEELTNAIMML